MGFGRDFVLDALLQHNYFPMQSTHKDELPPVLGSESFSVEAAREVAGCWRSRKASGCDYRGFDAVEYRLTRYTGVPRTCMLPHPTAYAHLALAIHESWSRIDRVATNPLSLIRPREHTDGRLIVMNYETDQAKTDREMKAGFGMRFTARTDISNCFPSIYTHALSWALVGFKEAKDNRGKPGRWYNRLDEAARWIKRNETNGVAIGPATSNVLSEIILGKVDGKLATRFDFYRFIDDYTCYCKTEQDAQEFIRRLSHELAEFKLSLNGGKTRIEALPRTASGSWIIDIRRHLPEVDSIPPRGVRSFMDYSIQLASKHPEGSVLKYALRCVSEKAGGDDAKRQALRYGVTLAFHQPALLPLLDSLVNWDDPDELDELSDAVLQIGAESGKFHRSDAMSWSLYYLAKAHTDLPKELVDAVFRTRDCVALTILLLFDDKAIQRDLQAFARLLDPGDLYELDQYWLFLYEMYRRGLWKNPYGDDDTFSLLRTHDVAFLRELS